MQTWRVLAKLYIFTVSRRGLSTSNDAVFGYLPSVGPEVMTGSQSTTHAFAVAISLATKKSDNPKNPSYNPSIFPQEQRTPHIDPAVVSQSQLQRKRTRAPESQGRRRQTPHIDPAVVSQPQLQRKRTRAPESQGRRRQYVEEKEDMAFELQSASTNESEEYNQASGSLIVPTLRVCAERIPTTAPVSKFQHNSGMNFCVSCPSATTTTVTQPWFNGPAA
ncbi:uncharacterized protein LOC119386150 [Rhipicephalus sanguineus]|uniref:uncharacterized protein LOC119386150 n=1 Tax=Rhipicephalus sanguineus TaxID=34632 RepID=UPI0020C1D532|nr:uncharacterized protein LOC119386150 [Rhipicephalus sanguineus]